MGTVALFIPHMGCSHACSFCDQRLISGKRVPVTPETVREELRRAFSYPHKMPPEIAFFGGSFTCIDQQLMTAFLDEAKPYLQSGAASSLRCSTRPDGITKEILAILKMYGMETVELGAQSLDDGVLARNLRGHTAADVEQAVQLLKADGFKVGLQIMTGLPGDTKETLSETVEKIVRLRPDCLRVYPTVVIRGTLLHQWMEAGSFTPMETEEAVLVCADILRRMERESIPVIRMGLHAEETLSAEWVGGAYHPAFRELCAGRIYYEDVLAAMDAPGSYLLLVPKKDISKAVGHRRQNIEKWKQAGFLVAVCGDEQLTGGFRLSRID